MEGIIKKLSGNTKPIPRVRSLSFLIMLRQCLRPPTSLTTLQKGNFVWLLRIETISQGNANVRFTWQTSPN